MDAPDIHWGYSIYSSFVLLADFLIRFGFSIRIIMRKRPYGVSLAWLVVILLFPFVGGFFYLLFGENRLPDKRIARAKVSYDTYMLWLQLLRNRSTVDKDRLDPELEPLQRQAERLTGMPVMDSNQIRLLINPDEILEAITSEIKNAQSTCHLQFYIWEEGGRITEVNQALVEASRRGVRCRLLLDSIGSRDFLRSETAREMKEAGVRIQESLPTGIISALFARIDIRNHRKIVIIDGETAFTGSQNMVDPDFFRKEAGVGNWIDVMAQLRGPIVESLAGTFISDWFLEADGGSLRSKSLLDDINSVRKTADMKIGVPAGECPIQLAPSGPGYTQDAIHSLLLTTLYAARKELVLTTPYFIPDQSLLDALKAAAQRGVLVKIILPKENDSRLIKYASRARYEELMEAGVRIYQFHGGLLHSKTITVDGKFSLFGSVNLDMRSFWLNFEATLFIYCTAFTTRLIELQNDYLQESALLNYHEFRRRGMLNKFKENCVLLISPLL